ncbi:MAG: NDP-sugar synthase [Candidatus Heimdallarchaeota archaeon]|nr:NDP-sugar synthase [Candidatus Heimdallarchaeota archaeon]
MSWMAVILAGGIGSRLFPLTKERPKPLVPIANRAMIDYAITSLRDAGIRKIVIAVKYLGDQIREWIENHPYEDTEIIIPDIDPRDTADAVRLCADHIDRNFIVTMSDIVTNLDIKDAIDFHEAHGQIATICLKPVDSPGQFGLTMLDNAGRIHLFLEKPSPTELLMTTMTFTGKAETLHMHHNLANIGIYVFNSTMRDILINYGDLMDFGKHVFPFLLDYKYDVRGFLSTPYWMDAGTILKYIWTNNDVAKRWAFPYLPIEEDKGDGYYQGNNVELNPNCTIIPPVVLGDRSIVENGCTIGPNVTIGSDVKIGAGSNIKNSVIWNHSSIDCDTIMEKTVVAESVKIVTKLVVKRVFPSNTIVTDDNIDQFTWK